MSKKTKKSKGKKQSQLKMPNTGRIDADVAFEAQAEKVRLLQEKRQTTLDEEIAERAKLTEMHHERGGALYTYEDADGELRDVELPKKEEPTSKVRKHKSKAADGGE